MSLDPLPSKSAIQDPECAGSAVVAWVIGVKPSVEVWVQDVAPDSKPGFARSCAAGQPPPPAEVTVRVYEAVCEPVDAVPVTVIGYVPAGVAAEVATVSVEDAPESPCPG